MVVFESLHRDDMRLTSLASGIYRVGIYTIDEAARERRALQAILESINGHRAENTANRVVDKDGSQA